MSKWQHRLTRAEGGDGIPVPGTRRVAGTDVSVVPLGNGIWQIQRHRFRRSFPSLRQLREHLDRIGAVAVPYE
jgi:hypothetical protein